MVSLLLCLGAFVICLIAGRHSLLRGLVVLLAIGYIYGITRANVPDPYSHFVFDAGVLGFYCCQVFRRLSPAQQARSEAVRPWLEFLIAWPLLLLLIPSQDFLIRLVGLRGNIFFLPFIMIGTRLDDGERYGLARWLAVLNLGALAFATVEFFIGLESFFPHNEITQLIYFSKDVASYSAYRIPSTFLGSHAYAGSMVMTLPFLLGALQQKRAEGFHKFLLMGGVIASLLGVLMAASRLHFVTGAIILLVAVFSMNTKATHLLALILILAGIGWLVAGDQRLQRFTELKNTEMISDRIVGSVNMGFFELAVNYPFGNGLGGGGTSIPYFLRDRIEKPVVMENEYARIMLEEGVLGLGIWVAFIIWLLTRPALARGDSWALGRRLAWVACALYFATGLIGTGLLTSIPHTCLLLLSTGWVAARRPERVTETGEATAQSLVTYPPLSVKATS